MTAVVDLVEPFYGGSHRAWADGWMANSQHEIRLHTLPARAWRWRMRGAAITLASRLQAAASNRPADLVVVSDMIDVADLIVHTRSTHAAVPVVLYLHENQLTYPRQAGEALDAGLASATWRNLVAADEIWCNSTFHRESLLGALPDFLAAVPDEDHIEMVDAVAAKMIVLPVGVDLLTPQDRAPANPPLIVSNHRWHHDNDVAAIARALHRLADAGLVFEVAFVGDDAGGDADAIHPVLDALGDRVIARGHQPVEEYRALLQRADVVVSAARNEFFGISVIEAASAGAVPVLPNALAYPETMFAPSTGPAAVLYEPGGLTAAIESTVRNLRERRAAVAHLPDALRRFGWDCVAPRYDAAVERLIRAR